MNKQNEYGFTLVEVIVAIIIMGIFMFAMTGMVRTYQDSYSQARNVGDELQNANFAMQMMVREIRGAQAVPAMTINASQDTLSFTDSGGNSITYQWVPPSLFRNGQILAGNVTNVSFIPAGSSTNPSTVMILLTVGITTKNKLTRTTLFDSVKPRNINRTAF